MSQNVRSTGSRLQTPPAGRRSMPPPLTATNSASHRLDIDQVQGPKIALKNLPVNRQNDLQVARQAAEDLSRSNNKDPYKAWVESLPPTSSPSRAIVGNSDSQLDRWLLRNSIDAAGVLGLRILSDCFFYQCGFRDSQDIEIPVEENRNWPKQSQPAGSRAKCVSRHSAQLKQEADLSLEELKIIVTRRAFRGPINTNRSDSFDRSYQNAAAYEHVVGVLGNQLLQFFRANPNKEELSIVAKMFKWVTGAEMEEAFENMDERLLTRRGVVEPPRSPFYQIAEMDEEEQRDLERFEMGNFAE